MSSAPFAVKVNRPGMPGPPYPGQLQPAGYSAEVTAGAGGAIVSTVNRHSGDQSELACWSVALTAKAYVPPLTISPLGTE